MPVLVILIIIALAFYVFYKTKYFRTKWPMERKWLSAKSSMALGAFVALFGINQLFIFQTTTTYIVATIFIIIGGLSLWSGSKAYKFFLPLAIEEASNK
ncbi:YtpI family protein [Bacillus massiliigorillae]|uniref:YtpI family protein n=1 Tax=Bacillus massiliigorillae TaxID=1243664 RepID=UPI0003AACB6D|nr:YtpI family protein [Bacillus massiliigorillae]